MGVKIKHTVGGQNQKFVVVVFFVFFSKCISDGSESRNMGHNQRQKCENLCLCPSKLNGVHGKLKKNVFGCKFCRICHLGRLTAITIDVLCCCCLFFFSINDAKQTQK